MVKTAQSRYDLLEELKFTERESLPAANYEAAVVPQDAATFAQQAAIVRAAAPAARWVNPSAHDADRAELLTPDMSTESGDPFGYVEPIGAGRIRGLILHKLMEELLTGELSPQEDVAKRAEQLRDELLAIRPADGPIPTSRELATTTLQTYWLPYVQRLLPVLVPELSIWGELALPIHDDLRFRAFAAFGTSGRTGSFGFFTA